MPLTKDQKKLLMTVKEEYIGKGYSEKHAEKIANAVVYGKEKKRFSFMMHKVRES